MAEASPLSHKKYFAGFELDLRTAELRNGAERVVLAGKPFEVLKALLERPGELVTRRELIERLWPEGTYVDFDQSLNKAVNRLREALDDSADAPTLVETLPRKGYRFVGVLSDCGVEGDLPVPQAAPPNGSVPVKVLGERSKENQHLPGAVPLIAELVSLSHGRQWGRIMLSLTAGAALVGLAIWMASRLTRKNDGWIQTNRVTNSGQVTEVALSPDGKFLVYALDTGQSSTLRLREIGKGTDVEMLSAGPSFHGLTYSNDGREIYVLRSDPNDAFFKYLYAISTTGGSVRKIISDVDSPVSFSPDGQQFVYEHCLQPRNDIELIIADANGESKRHLATLHQVSGFLYQPGVAWSPDGKTVAVPALSTSEPQVWTMYAVAVADGSVHATIASPEQMGRPIWMDRTMVVLPHFDRYTGAYQMWSVSMASGKARSITLGLGAYLDEFSATTDRRMLAGISLQRSANVWSAPLDEPEAAQQVTHSGTPLSEVAEFFDGKLLVVDRDGVPWLMVADGTQWTKFADLDRVSGVIPCGQFVLFLIKGSNYTSLVRLDRDGTHLVSLARGNLYGPVCAADGASVFYVTTQQPQRVWKLGVEGGDPQQVAAVMGNQVTDRLAVSPDGKYLAYPFTQYGHVPSDGWHIGVILATGGTTVSIQPISSDVTDLHWSPDGTSLLYLRLVDGVSNLWEQPVFGGRARQVTKFHSGQAFHFNWSIDDKRLLMTRGETATEAVLFGKPH
jgi:DNA-binding winged helix-turn-helix (wHTH) protein/Tol biopolymer transport system component